MQRIRLYSLLTVALLLTMAVAAIGPAVLSVRATPSNPYLYPYK